MVDGGKYSVFLYPHYAIRTTEHEPLATDHYLLLWSDDVGWAFFKEH